MIIPPIPDTAYPDTADPNVNVKVLVSVAVIVCGIITSFDALYTVTFGYCTPKLCETVHVDVADDCVCIFPPAVRPVICDPSPLNEPDIVEPDTNKEPVIIADPLNGKPTPAPDPEM